MLILWIIVIGWEADSRQEIILVRLPPISSFMRHFLSCIGVCFAFRTRSCWLKVHGPGRLPLIKATILSSLLCDGTAGGTCQEKMTQIMTWSWSPGVHPCCNGFETVGGSLACEEWCYRPGSERGDSFGSSRNWRHIPGAVVIQIKENWFMVDVRRRRDGSGRRGQGHQEFWPFHRKGKWELIVMKRMGWFREIYSQVLKLKVFCLLHEYEGGKFIVCLSFALWRYHNVKINS